MLNNPLRYTDPSGNIPEIIYDETLGIYMVKLDIQIYGSGASDSLAKEWEEHLNEVWNCGDYDYEGQPVFFVINIYHQNPDFSLGGKLLNALGFEGIAMPKAGDSPNLAFVPEGSSIYPPMVLPHIESERAYDWGNNWYSEMGTGYALHESVHMLGIYEDRYYEATGKPVPAEYENYVSAHGKGNLSDCPAVGEVREIINLAVDRGQLRKVATELPTSE